MSERVAVDNRDNLEIDTVVVTHCDSNYLSRALCLVNSLQRNGFQGPIVVFTHDQVSWQKLTLLNLTNTHIEMISILELEYPELHHARINRSVIEYYYAITPFLLKYIQKEFQGRHSVYLDSDLFFFEPLQDVVESLDDSIIAITPHRFNQVNRHLEKYGKYNVGLVSFTASSAAIKILDWWANQCLASTSQDISNGVYGDQKYLDKFVEMEPGVKVLANPGYNAAPWNLDNSVKSENQIWIESGEERDRLVFFHFSGLKRFRFLVLLGFMPFHHKPSVATKKLIYIPYLKCLRRSELLLRCNSKDSVPMPSLRNLINYIRYWDLIITFLPHKNSLR